MKNLTFFPLHFSLLAPLCKIPPPPTQHIIQSHAKLNGLGKTEGNHQWILLLRRFSIPRSHFSKVWSSKYGKICNVTRSRRRGKCWFIEMPFIKKEFRFSPQYSNKAYDDFFLNWNIVPLRLFVLSWYYLSARVGSYYLNRSSPINQPLAFNWPESSLEELCNPKLGNC